MQTASTIRFRRPVHLDALDEMLALEVKRFSRVNAGNHDVSGSNRYRSRKIGVCRLPFCTGHIPFVQPHLLSAFQIVDNHHFFGSYDGQSPDLVGIEPA